MKNIDEMSGPQLAAKYNEIAAANGKPTVKKFKDLKTGRQRLTRMMTLHPVEPPKPTKPPKKKGTKTASSQWEAHKAALVTIKSETRAVEMVVDKHLSGGERLQFSEDVRVYGLYEAVLYADQGHRGLALDLIKELKLDKPKKAAAEKAAKEKKPRKTFVRQRAVIAMPKGSNISLPRTGTMKARALARLCRGTTIEELIAMYDKHFASLDTPRKIATKIRAREIILLLHTQNDIGFEERDGKIWAITE